MSTTICKFGGSSVSDASMFVRVNRIIRSDPSRRYIILSAPGKRYPEDEKITDMFYRAYKASICGDYSILAEIFTRYASIRDALAPNFDLEGEFAKIRKELHTSLDFAASRGEYLCAKLFAAYANIPFVDASELMFFDPNGEINQTRTQSAIHNRLSPLDCAVVPGFYGIRADGNIQTFTRGGSDVSGALLASALKASLYENWTDVDGLYTADPNTVPDTVRNMNVNLYQMERIAAAGARLLHPDALKPLQGTGIDTVLKNTFSPGAPGTRISESFKQMVRCVTGRRSLYMIGDPSSGCDEGILLHELPLSGSVKVAAVSIFGLANHAKEELKHILNPIHIIHMQDHLQIIIPDSEYETTIRTAHKILMQ